MLAPNAKTENAHAAQRQHNEAFLPNGLARKRGNQMRDEAKAREHGDVDFRLREKPEEALPKNGNGVRNDTGRLIGDEIQHRKKVCAQESIGQQADASRQEDAENQHAENGVDEPGPDGQRQPGQGHSMGAQVDGGDAEIERVEERCGAEDGHAEDPQRDGWLRGNEKRRGQAEERGHGGPEREEVQCGESHFARADLQRKKIISEAGLRRRREHQKNHERTMQRSQRCKTIRRIAEGGEKRQMHTRPNQVDAHEQRHRHAKKNTEEREPQVVEANGFVVGIEDVTGQKAALRRFLVICSDVVLVHTCGGSFCRPVAEPSRWARDK